MARVRLDAVHKTYPNGHQAVKGVDLDIADGQLMVLVGPSGCGKSTALRMVAGLELPTSGRVWIGDRDVTGVRVQDRDVAMVFQNYALYPHRTVRQNLAFALELRSRPRADIDRRIGDVADALGLSALLDRKPAQLSGGERQRVALGRAIVRDPQVFLFDEPLSNLDAKLRVATRTELSRLHRRLRATMIYVTHDQEEAMTLGDRIAVLHQGRVQQCDQPLEVYRRPANVFVAGFVGSPAMNLLDGRLTREGDALMVTVESSGGATSARALTLPMARASDGPVDAAMRQSAGSSIPVRLGIRPEDVAIVGPGAGDAEARVDVVERLGSAMLVHLDLAGTSVRAVVAADARIAEEDVVGVRLTGGEQGAERHDRLHLFDGRTGVRLN